MSESDLRRSVFFPVVRYALGLFGLTLTRTSSAATSYRIHKGKGRFDDSQPVPVDVAPFLHDDHGDLVELRARYEQLASPFRAGHFWRRNRRLRDFNLKYFRGDNAYVWQLRQLGDNARLKTFLYTRYISSIDQRKLLERLTEDGAFGCWTFNFRSLPTVSRDLLDSINEIYFLNRHWDLFSRTGHSIVDIGAGYGRLAHRMVEAAPALNQYFCVDAIPESTYLCEHYLKYRGVDDKALVLQLDEMEKKLTEGRPDLAVNIHSFSEMPISAIQAWIELLARVDVPALLIVPNEGRQLLSLEDGCMRLDFAPLLARHGYTLAACEPTIADSDVRDLLGVGDFFMFFVRNSARPPLDVS